VIYLIDTQLILWAAEDRERLSQRAIELMGDEKTGLMFSAAVIWEVAIKSRRNRADFRADARVLRRSLLENGYTELPISSEHASAVVDLPAIHRDPFDRIQVAQARVEGLVLLTADDRMAEYGDPVELV
jgi:PIN domain nuclease of toxin-antitoxin system